MGRQSITGKMRGSVGAIRRRNGELGPVSNLELFLQYSHLGHLDATAPSTEGFIPAKIRGF